MLTRRQFSFDWLIIMMIWCITFFRFQHVFYRCFIVCFNYSCHSVRMSCWIKRLFTYLRLFWRCDWTCTVNGCCWSRLKKLIPTQFSWTSSGSYFQLGHHHRLKLPLCGRDLTSEHVQPRSARRGVNIVVVKVSYVCWTHSANWLPSSTFFSCQLVAQHQLRRDVLRRLTTVLDAEWLSACPVNAFPRNCELRWVVRASYKIAV